MAIEVSKGWVSLGEESLVKDELVRAREVSRGLVRLRQERLVKLRFD